MILSYIILSTFIISLIAFVGALTLILKEKILDKIIFFLVALAAGALLGGAFLHLIPEAIEESSNILNVFLFVILGFCVFFILEQFLLWHHHHSTKHKKHKKPVTYLILISDAVHNFIDGLVIAAGFIISIPIGLVTTIAIALHEIPQEIGDFGVLIYGGFKKGRALFFNFLSAITAILGGIVGFLLSGNLGASMVYLLPFAAGNFLYIATTDLIPVIKTNEKRSTIMFIIFLLGIFIMFGLRFLE